MTAGMKRDGFRCASRRCLTESRSPRSPPAGHVASVRLVRTTELLLRLLARRPSRRERQRRKPEGSTYKEYKQRNLELVALETEILFESIEPSLRDVDAVEE
jgi:hypothetical protein